MSNSVAPSADLPPDVQVALDRLAHFYDGSQPYNPNTNPGGMRNGGHRRNFIPALVDAVTALNAIVALMQGAIAIGNDVTSTAAIAQPLLDQAVARLQEALQAADDAETARDGAQTARAGSEAAQAASEAASASSDQSRAAAVVARSGAETARAGAETAQGGAEAAFSDADDARVAAQTARLGAEDAQTGARAARADAASYAAQIGVAAYDFSFDTDPDPSNDWSIG